MLQPRLERLAYRMLGSVADAEDVVQEARVRLLKLAEKPDNEEAFLHRVVSNLAIDRLRQRKRQGYPGPWLPEPLPTAEPADDDTDAATLAELADELSLGFLLMLERLSAGERVVFLLREGFDYSFQEIGELVGASAAACRQRYHRAKRNLRGEARGVTPPEEQRRLLDGLVLAVAERDTEALLRLFSEDAVVLADGGGVVSAAIRPVTGRARIVQIILHLAGKALAEGGIEFRQVAVNGGAGLLITQHGQVHSLFQLEGSGGVIDRLYVSRNPNKLSHVASLLGEPG